MQTSGALMKEWIGWSSRLPIVDAGLMLNRDGPIRKNAKSRMVQSLYLVAALNAYTFFDCNKFQAAR